MKNRYLTLAIAASISLLSACGNSATETPGPIISSSKVVTVTDATSDYKEICINGTVYYKSIGGGNYATLAPKVLTQQKLFGDMAGPAPGYHVHC